VRALVGYAFAIIVCVGSVGVLLVELQSGLQPLEVYLPYGVTAAVLALAGAFYGRSRARRYRHLTGRGILSKP